MARAGQPSNFSNEIKQAMLPRTLNKGAGGLPPSSNDMPSPKSANDANDFNENPKKPIAKKGAMPPQFTKKGAA